MDSKQFDELVARLASGTTRRTAVKGVVGGALASVGVTSVVAAKKHKASAEHKKKGKRGKKCKSKQTICHKPYGSPAVTLVVSACAVKAHLGHGDSLGPC